MSESTKKIRKKDCVKLSNKIIERCKLPIPRVTSIDGIRSNLFTSLLQVLYHRLPEGIIDDPASTEDEIANVQAIINHLALDLIHIDLSHISGTEVIAGEPRAIYNLLEIFCGLHKYLSSTSIGRWNLEESLSEANSELSSQPSSEESAVGGRDQDAPPVDADPLGDPAEQDSSPPLTRPSSSVARAGSAGRVPSVPSAGAVSAGRSSSAARVRSSASGVARAPSSASAGRPASGSGSAARVPSSGSAGRVRSGGSVGMAASGVGSVVRVASGASAGRVASSGSAGKVPSSTSAGKVPSSTSAGKVPSSSSAGKIGSATRVPSSGSAGKVASSTSAGRVASSGSAGKVPSAGSVPRVPSGGASVTKVASTTSAGRASAHSSATRVPSSGSGLGRVRSSGSGSRPTSSGPLPTSSISAGGEAEASMFPSSESATVPAERRRSASSGGGSGGAGAAGSSGAGAEPASSLEGLEGKPSQASRHSLQPELAAVDTETSEDDPSPIRAPSGAAAAAGGEFDALGRSSVSRPSAGGLGAAGGGSGAAVQLSGSIEHHHYHHYEGEESGESGQLTELTADTEEEEEEQGYGSEPGEEAQGYGSEPQEEEEDSQLTEEPTADSPEETQGESEPDSQTPWEADESPEEEEDGQEDTAGEEEDAGGHGDVSRQLSEEMELMRAAASSPEPPPPPPVQRASVTQQQRSVNTFRRASRDTDSTDGMRRATADADRPSRRELSAPARRPSSSDRRRRRRSDDFSSASEPGMGRRSGARLPTRNVETIAEIRETDAERAITETTREQAGDQLHKETVRREVRRKVSSAPATRSRQMSYTKQATRRSVCSDGVTDWLESQADDTRLHVDGKEADVFEYLRREFPYVHVSAETKRRLLAQYRHQMKYIMSLVEPVESRKIKIRRQDVLKRQALMTDIMRQQKAHDDRFKKLSDGKRREAKIRNMPRDSKISCLRAQRYVSSFQQQFQSRSAFNKSKEELLLRAVFEEMLEIQRSRLRAVRRLEKESIDEFYDANGYTADLNRVHQYYEANFRELAELLAKERSDLMRTQKQQKKLNDRIKREFREYMEADVRSLNDKIVNSWQPQFRELDADRVRSDLYEANWKFCVQ
ncbi:centrosomal protein of 95 kDa-like isoform X2 [Amphibalanus amphitrite]|uniref:centrosomal protein of 95 kDa-like isoform X2 n=1 Tax=Amphibalanus amphitrite TaxID=1232801 RepID=UPI001C92523F|nr:centrosomal protein of 95 kDa-like isoform X2 [Amphibalanus amphitrite]XP_043208830.1 centrosomal protein of 95 kDa-like isoform X2 [Amphibalanus amphitrite]